MHRYVKKACKKAFIVSIFLVVALNFVPTAHGAPVPVPPAANENPCRNISGDTNKSIPDTFSVGDCLRATGQEDSKFFPKKDPPKDQKAAQQPSAQSILIAVIDLLIKVIGSLALVIFIVGALLTVTSEGKEDRLEHGKTAMMYAAIGLIVSFLSFIIVTYVQSIFF